VQDAVIVCQILGFMGTIFGAYELFCGLATMNWRPVPGEVVDKYLEESQAAMTWSDQPETIFGKGWVPIVQYRYSVRGKDYEGETINRRISSLPWKYGAELRMRRYEVGQPVKVYFSPSDPSQAVLKRFSSGGGYLAFVLGVMFLTLAKILS
jgi:hypothetical protein